MADVTIYTTTYCPYCVRAKKLFGSLGVAFDEVNLEEKPELREELTRKHNWRTVPMIFAGERFLGGFDDVNELHKRGELMPIVEKASGQADA